ncbi:MAG TPA: hypothetical protein VMV45_04370 [Casimicrobiaceae bacterium]|nr:hypothetical protein [Casimicrobiaceae bacterium]
MPLAAFEAFPTLEATEFVAPDVLNGPHYKVAPQVTIDSYLAKFEIQSDYGTLTALGSEMLRVRLREFPAIASLSEVSQTKAFTDAVAKGAQAPVDFAKTLATDPQKAASNVASGVGALFSSAGRAVKQAATSVSDKTSDTTGNPSSSGGATSFTDDPIGYNKAKREWAKRLGVDPYSTNPLLQEKLSAAAQASFAGGFAMGLAVGAVIGPAQYAVDLEQSTRDAVWDRSPGELEASNEATLASMGITGRPVRDFLRTPSFTPTLSTALVAALKDLSHARGAAAVIAAAPSVASEVQARFMVNALHLLHAFGERGDPVTELRMSGRVPIGISKSGVVVVPAALDYLPWTEQLATFVNRKDVAGKRHVLLVTGRASDIARRELAARQWQIEQATLGTR